MGRVRPLKGCYRKGNEVALVHPSAKYISETPEFKQACQDRNITPSKRQAAKWRNKLGRWKDR